MSSGCFLSSPFPANKSSFDNGDTYPDVDFVIPGLEKPFRLHTDILSKASLAFGHMFKGNDLACCKYDQEKHRVEWIDEKAVTDETYRSLLQRFLRFCYGDCVTLSVEECPVALSLLAQIQLQGQDAIKSKIENFLTNAKKEKEEEDNKVQSFIRSNGLQNGTSITMREAGPHGFTLCTVLKRNATPTQSLYMECFGKKRNHIDEYVRDCSMTDSLGQDLGEALETNTTLTSLTVRVGGKGANCICESLQRNKTLTFLSLDTLGKPQEEKDEFGEQLAPMMRVNSTLKGLDIFEANVGKRYMKPFFDAVKTCHPLEYLKCAYEIEQGEYIGEVLESNNGIKVLELELRPDFWDHSDPNNGLIPIGRALKTNSTLTKLKLTEGKNLSLKDTSNGIRALAEGLASNHSITSLDLDCGCEGTAMAEALKQNSTLTRITLSHTHIGEEEMSAIAAVLRNNTSIRELNLGGNSAVGEGMQALFECLKSNKTLTSLDVSYAKRVKTKMERKAYSLIPDVLKVNTTLKELNLSNCKLGEKTTKKLMEALSVNTTLTCLKYKGNHIGKEVCTSFDKFMSQSPTIKTHEIDYAYVENCTVM